MASGNGADGSITGVCGGERRMHPSRRRPRDRLLERLEQRRPHVGAPEEAAPFDVADIAAHVNDVTCATSTDRPARGGRIPRTRSAARRRRADGRLLWTPPGRGFHLPKSPGAVRQALEDVDAHPHARVRERCLEDGRDVRESASSSGCSRHGGVVPPGRFVHDDAAWEEPVRAAADLGSHAQFLGLVRPPSAPCRANGRCHREPEPLLDTAGPPGISTCSASTPSVHAASVPAQGLVEGGLPLLPRSHL